MEVIFLVSIPDGVVLYGSRFWSVCVLHSGPFALGKASPFSLQCPGGVGSDELTEGSIFTSVCACLVMGECTAGL